MTHLPQPWSVRSPEHLIRQITTRNSNVPNFSLFLGAGSSFTSGIVRAGEMIDRWRKQLHEAAKTGLALDEWLRQQDWFEDEDEYAILFEMVYDEPSQRRVYIEECVKDGRPSWGYVYLTNLLANRIFNVVFTTNFDDLINEACYLYSEGLRPIVAAHDSAISGIRVTSDRPKIVKLHGDFLYDNIKNTVRELETLELNTKAKLAQFAQEYGLVLIGYSGRDRSVMDTLEVLLKTGEYFRQGIYWCIRRGGTADLGKRVRSLLRRDRVYLVEIDGYDEFMAELNRAANLKLPQPISQPLKVARDRARLFVDIPDSLRGHYIIGADVNRVLDAITSASATPLSSDETMPEELRATVEDKRGRREEAFKLWQASVAANPGDQAFINEMAQMLVKMEPAELKEIVARVGFVDFITTSGILPGNKTFLLLCAHLDDEVIRISDALDKEGQLDFITGVNRAISLKRLGRTEDLRREIEALKTLFTFNDERIKVLAQIAVAALEKDQSSLVLRTKEALKLGYMNPERIGMFPVFEDFSKDPEMLKLREGVSS